MTRIASRCLRFRLILRSVLEVGLECKQEGGDELMFDSTERNRIFERKRYSRERAIDRLHSAAIVERGIEDRGYWTLVHDLELAALTTNLKQLEEIGVEVPMTETLEDDELRETLAAMIRGLAELEVYLLHSDHLDDRALYRRLRDDVLMDQVRDLPPRIGCREWIDLASGLGDPVETWLRYHASDGERSLASDRGEIVPPRSKKRADRDRSLPRPAA